MIDMRAIKDTLGGKNRYLYLALLLAVISLLAILAVKGRQDDGAASRDEAGQALMDPPVAEGRKVTDKLDAYRQAEREERERKREMEESRVKGSDFYFDMQDDKYEERMEARIQRMRSDPYTNVMSEYGGNPGTPSTSSTPQGTATPSGNGDNTFADRMRRQLDGIEDQQTIDEIISEAKKNERIRKKMKESDEFHKGLYEEYIAPKTRGANGGGSGSPAPSNPPEPASPAPAGQARQDDKARRREAMRAWNKDGGQVPDGKTYQAVIHKTQTVANGQMAMFRTREEIETGSLRIPANTLLYGAVSVSQNRLGVTITSVTINRNVYPVRLAVYGTDGAPGIPVQMDKVQKAADNKVGDEVVNAVRSRTGIIGGVIGSIASATKSVKEISCTLIDNQVIYLKISK